MANKGDSEVPPVQNMSRFLRPDRFETDPSSVGSELKWKHWYYTFNNFISAEFPNSTNEVTKLMLLANHLSPTVFSLISECQDFKSAIVQLEKSYVKIKNEVHARHILATRRQHEGESVDEYLRELKNLSQNCNFKACTAEEHKSEYIRDAFIRGLSSNAIRQRLLENLTLTLDGAHNQACSLEMAERNTKSYTVPHMSNYSANISQNNETQARPSTSSEGIAVALHKVSHKKSCFFCGSPTLHPRFKCPAFKATCLKCGKKGHFAKVCRNDGNINFMQDVTHNSSENLMAISAAAPGALSKATTPITINEHKAEALIDTGSTLSFIDSNLASTLKLKRKPCNQSITLASHDHTSIVKGMCYATLKIQSHVYKQLPLLIVNNLCADVIIGHDLLKDHESLMLEFGGPKEALKVCSVMAATVPAVSVFTNMSPDIRPIAIKSRNYKRDDEEFIKAEVTKLLEDGVIEPSISPWRAQVLVTGGDGIHRRRMVIDYSLTINKYTLLDAYPLQKIETIVAKVAKNNFFSQIDLKSAYHQIKILEKEKIYTTFEACGKLYQFTRIPFGVTNGVAAFQRALQYVIDTEKLTGVYAYLDDITICGKDKVDLDFMKAVEKYQLTINIEKSVFCVDSINLLGYTIHNNEIKPDKKRLEPLVNLPPPSDQKELRRTLGMFAHYSKWIHNFSEKIHPLVITTFPLTEEATLSFNRLKLDIADSVLTAIDDHEMFTVETDASDHSLAATLTQKNRPVAFFSRTLTNSEKRQSSIEKEACAVVEALKKWRHYLIGRHFLLITDQQSVSFMFDQKHSNKIKNEKIERWRLELSCYKYDIVYRPGKENIVADALSRVCANVNTDKLYNLHKLLCHPGVVRMTHWVRSKNLPYSISDIKAMTENCAICAEVKPRFYKSQGRLIKATAPFERLSMDFKGPLPSSGANRYILTIIDEYSRFPFAYACKDVSSSTVIKCLRDLFHVFGTPSYVHSDRGGAFISDEIKSYLTSQGVACSRTTPYNPKGNGQVERLNGTLWRTIQLCLLSKQSPIENWESVLPESLHAIRSLLCTATNETPHERMFHHPRRTLNGESLPSWLLEPGPILLKKNVRNSKYDPLVEQVELLESNPHYSTVRTHEGRETNVSNRHLAPLPVSESDSDSLYEDATEDAAEPSEPTPSAATGSNELAPPVPAPRRSNRVRLQPAYLRDYDTS